MGVGTPDAELVEASGVAINVCGSGVVGVQFSRVSASLPCSVRVSRNHDQVKITVRLTDNTIEPRQPMLEAVRGSYGGAPSRDAAP